MKTHYGEEELLEVLGSVDSRRGWDFSSMRATRAPVPWEYSSVVASHLRPTHSVLDVGTGGGEQLVNLAHLFSRGLGVDPDPAMVETARANASAISNLSFLLDDARLREVDETFDVVLNRHAVVDLEAARDHLRPAGCFITQQVGEKNMRNVRVALGEKTPGPPVARADLESMPGMVIERLQQYDVEYVVHDIASLLFWFAALDLRHADLDGQAVASSAAAVNAVLRGNVDQRGFVTNEHRYLVVARRA